ncbi:MAG: hypothetical protein FJZ92_09795 [Chloroflexi bacterium]|nr:hypothetical protein [Chloroflexota bacterium]
MSWLPEDVREASGGEVIDRAARDAIRLAHRALERFPDLVRRHKVIAGGAAISSSLIILAGVAIAHRMRKGQSPEEAVRSVTEEELQGHLPGDEVAADPPRAAEPQAGAPRVSGNGARPGAGAGADATRSH